MIQEFSSKNTLSKQQISTANSKDNQGVINSLSSLRSNLQGQYESTRQENKHSKFLGSRQNEDNQISNNQQVIGSLEMQPSKIQGISLVKSNNLQHLSNEETLGQAHPRDEVNFKQSHKQEREKNIEIKQNSQQNDHTRSIQMGTQAISPKHSSSQMKALSVTTQMNLLQATTATATSSTPHGGAFSSQGLSQNSATTGGGQTNVDDQNLQKHQDSQQSSSPTENERFLKVFSEMNEKAIESMNKDEPETSLEFLKKAEEFLKKLQHQHKMSQTRDASSSNGDSAGATRHSNKQVLSNQSLERSSKSRSKTGGGHSNNNTSNISGSQSQDSQSVNQLGEGDLLIDPNYKASLYYNLACCYQRLGLLEECVDYLELATKSLNKKILMLEDEENALLFNNTDPNSVDVDFNTINGLQNKRLTQQQQNRRQLSNNYGGCESGPNSSFSHQFVKSPSHSAKKRLSSNASSKSRKLRDGSQTGKLRSGLNEGKKTSKDNREKLLASKLHKLRYQCKFNLQLCAILSQINQHRDALIYGHKSANFCQKLVKESQLLCKRFMHQIQRSIKREQERQAQLANHVTSYHQQTYLDSNSGYNTMAPQTQLNSYRSNGNNQTMMTQIGGQGIVLNESSILNMLMQQQDSVHSQRASNLQTLNNSNYSIKNAKHSLRAHTSFGQGIAINYIKRSHHKNSSRSSFNSMERNAPRDGNQDDQLSGIEQSRRSHSSQSEKLNSRHYRQGQKGFNEDNNFIDKSEVDSVSSHSSVTRLRIYKNPFVRDSVNESSLSRYRDNSNESLERIHTFSLKNTFTKIKGTQPDLSQQNKGNTINDLPESKNKIIDREELKFKTESEGKNKAGVTQQINSIGSQRVQEKDQKSASLKRKSIDSSFKNENQEEGAASGTNKTYYVEESVKILESIIMQADPILSELASKVKQFEKIQNMTASERDSDLLDKYGEEEYDEQRNKLNISFHAESEINELKFNTDFKMSVRNVLGLRHSDDWIFNLNIGNVMHLSLMGAEELNAKLENTHELGKDSMLEKIVLVSVAYFCIGTEMRFLMSKQNSTITKKDSEAYHAKALHISTIFLPPDCPLVTHIVNSYMKNYLKDKKQPQITNKAKKQTHTADHSHTSTQAQTQLQQLLRPKSRQQQALVSQQKTFSPNLPSKQQNTANQSKLTQRQPQHNNQQVQQNNEIQPFNSRYQYLSQQNPNTKTNQISKEVQEYSSQQSYQNSHQNVQESINSVVQTVQRASRGKQHQPSQLIQSNLINLTQQQQIQQNHSRTSGSLGTVGAGTDSVEDSNSNPHSTDARANRVLATQLNQNYAVPRPHTQQLVHNLNGDAFQQEIMIQKQNKFQNQPIQGQGGQPLQPQKLQNDHRFIQGSNILHNQLMSPLSQSQQIKNQGGMHLIQQQALSQNFMMQDQQKIIKKLQNHPQSTKNSNQTVQQALIQQNFNLNPQQTQNLSYQRFINCRPSIEQNSEDMMIQNFVDIDLSGDISSLSAQGQSRLHQFNDNQLIQQQQQQLNNQLLQQQMQQLQLSNQVSIPQPSSQLNQKQRQQVKSQLNQISQIQMTNLIASNNHQQQIPANYNQLSAQAEFSQFSNTLSLRHNANAKTPNQLMSHPQGNHIQFSSGSSGGINAVGGPKNHGILGQNIQINAFNTIDSGVQSNQGALKSTKNQFSNLLNPNQLEFAGTQIQFNSAMSSQHQTNLQPTALINPKKKTLSGMTGAGSAVRGTAKQKLNVSSGGTTGGTLRLAKR